MNAKRTEKALLLAEQAIRWLAEAAPNFDEYECEHGVRVISGIPCDYPLCSGRVVRKALRALARARGETP